VRKLLIALALLGACKKEPPKPAVKLDGASPYGEVIERSLRQTDWILQEKGLDKPPSKDQITRALKLLKQTPGIAGIKHDKAKGRFVGKTTTGAAIDIEIYDAEFAALLVRIGGEAQKASGQSDALARVSAAAKTVDGVTVERATFLEHAGIRVARRSREGFIDISALPAR
jgi:hypothetical protein